MQAWARRFTMYRHAVPSTHELGVQANAPDEPQFEGVVFSNGKCALNWLTPHGSVSVWASFDDAMAVHGHPEYDSELVWHDPVSAFVIGPGDPYDEHYMTTAPTELEKEYEEGWRTAHRYRRAEAEEFAPELRRVATELDEAGDEERARVLKKLLNRWQRNGFRVSR